MAEKRIDHKLSRRQFVKQAAYITPAILSLAVAPAFAKAGSEKGKWKEILEKIKNPSNEEKGKELVEKLEKLQENEKVKEALEKLKEALEKKGMG
jgi:hypothetical protein